MHDSEQVFFFCAILGSCWMGCVLLGIVGEIEEGGDGYYVWTHKKLDIGYNENQIVDVNLTSEAKVKLTPDLKIPFTYEVCKELVTENNLFAHVQ